MQPNTVVSLSPIRQNNTVALVQISRTTNMSACKRNTDLSLSFSIYICGFFSPLTFFLVVFFFSKDSVFFSPILLQKIIRSFSLRVVVFVLLYLI